MLTLTRPEVYFATITNVLSDSYASLVETLNHMKSLKLRDHPGGDVTYCCNAILVDSERLKRDGSFKTKHLGYIIHIFEDNSDSRFYLWETQKYKEVMDFIKKLCVCDEYVMQPDDIITYGSLLQ